MIKEFGLENKLSLFICDAGELTKVLNVTDRFRVIFVLDGNGSVTLEDELFSYRKDNIFFVSSGQKFSFRPLEKTHVFVMVLDLSRSSGIKPQKPISSFKSLFNHIQYIFFTLDLTQGMSVVNETDQNSINSLIRLIVVEINNSQSSSPEIVKNTIFLIVNILSRNLNDSSYVKNETICHDETDKILEYIREQVHQNKKVDIRDIGTQFNLGMSSVDKSIIAKTGLSFKKYLIKSKMERFQNRLIKINV
jgi:hypothetical protein